MISYTGKVETGPVMGEKESVQAPSPPVHRACLISDICSVHVPNAEKQILRHLMCTPLASRDQIYEGIYGGREDGGPFEKIIDVYISKLRKKLDPAWRIETQHGMGFYLTFCGERF